MCLIMVGWQVHADFPLLVAANRDEFHTRSAAPAARWPEAPQVIGGRDLAANGTWLGITDSGRFAAVTNVREPGATRRKHSRGQLTRDFLLAEIPSGDFARSIAFDAFAGFNLLLSDGKDLIYCSNRGREPLALPPGIYGMSNHQLDTPWPKLQKARQNFTDALPSLPDESAFFELLADKSIAADADLPNTGIPLGWERMLSAIFVQSALYGTRASTVAWQRADGAIHLHERSFGRSGRLLQSSAISTAV